MTTTAIAKAPRVLHELTASEQFRRIYARAEELCKAGHNRVDAEFAQRIKEGFKECFGSDEESPTNGEVEMPA